MSVAGACGAPLALVRRAGSTTLVGGGALETLLGADGVLVFGGGVTVLLPPAGACIFTKCVFKLSTV